MSENQSQPRSGVGRRRFLMGMLAGTGALVVYGAVRGSAEQTLGAEPGDIEGAFKPNAYITITPDDRVLFALNKVEMGQGSMTGIAMLVAEELEVPVEKLEVFFANSADKYFETDPQMTGGSASIVGGFVPVRKIAAATRMMLVSAAAETWGVEPSTLRAEAGRVVEASGSRSASYGELVEAAKSQDLPQDPPIKERSEFAVVGKPIRRVDGRVKVTGTAEFGIDQRVPNMVRAVMIHPPRVGAKVVSFDPTAAKAMPGIVDVVETARGVGVVAEKYWQALRAAPAVEIEWSDGPGEDFSTEVLRADLAASERERAKTVQDDGDVDAALADTGAGTVLEAVYEAPYLAHSSMEPMNAIAHVTDGACEIWTGCQIPAFIQEAVAQDLGIERTDVLVHMPYLGGGFGRRSHPDAVLEAVWLSQAVGRPVQVIWSRENDMRAGYYRPQSLTRMRGAIDASGKPTVLSYDSLSQPIFPDFDFTGMLPTAMPPRLRRWLVTSASRLVASNAVIADFLATEGASNLPYAIPNKRVAYTPFDTPLQVSPWRSVGHSFNGFIIESFIDEMAHAAQQDPYQFRRELLADSPRWRGVLDAAAQMSGWSEKPKPEGGGRGIAVISAFGSYAAQVIEARVDDGVVKVDKVYCALDCGFAVNPDLVVSQVEGCVVFGLTAALWGQITVEDGVVQQDNFDTYRMMRMHECPQIEVRLVEGPHEPGGVGEPAVAPLGGALSNALFDATGARLRRMPIQVAWNEWSAAQGQRSQS
ncbi:MAG: xanthine dehydrogenase family protein molybdopterin-binding subunit [Myxococcota bacterium]